MDQYSHAEPVEIPEEALKLTLENEEPGGLGQSIYKTMQRSPFLIAGILGFGAVCGIGAYKWKTRTIKPSLFFIQLRVAAQSTALGFITLGMVYQMYKDYASKQKPT